MARGRHAEAAAELESLVGEHPLREQLCRLLMLALYRSGRQAEALDAYRRARDVLSGELGLEPSAALRNLERAILRQDPSLDPSPGHDTPPVAPRSVLVADGGEGPSLDRLIGVAESIVRPGTHELILARLVDGDTGLAPAAAAVRARCEELERRGSVARAAVFTSERPGDDLVRLAAEQDVDLLLVTAPNELLDSGAVDGAVAAVLDSALCDVALLAGGEADTRGPVVVPFGGADHDWAAVELGAWAARARGAPLLLLGADAAPGAGKRDASRLLSHASLAVQRALGVAAEPKLVTPGVEAILVASESAGLLVLGLSARWRTQGSVLPDWRWPGTHLTGAPRPQGPPPRRARPALRPDAVHVERSRVGDVTPSPTRARFRACTAAASGRGSARPWRGDHRSSHRRSRPSAATRTTASPPCSWSP